MKQLILPALLLCLTSCSTTDIVAIPHETALPAQLKMPSTPHLHVHATYGIGNDPAVIKAYKTYLHSGVSHTIRSKGFQTFSFDSYQQPLVRCAPLHLCIIQLEENEIINNINIGDSAHWLVTTAEIGSSTHKSLQVVLKPTLFHLSTDLVITTDKRTYNIGLVSDDMGHTEVVNFYYPKETFLASQNNLRDYKAQSVSQIKPNPLLLHLQHLDFQYKLAGQHPSWRPIRAFNDHHKTYIEMPNDINLIDLPVLYLLNHNHMQLVNYRYKAPYFIVDGLFEKAILLSGKGHSRVSVTVTHQ